MKIAGVQFDVQWAQPEANLQRMAEFLRETSAAGARLTVFPEWRADRVRIRVCAPKLAPMRNRFPALPRNN